MNQLAKLYLDEDVSVVLGKILAGRGFDVLTARDAGMLRKSDEEQLIFAIAHSRVVLSHNRQHFEELHLRFIGRQLEHSGIIVAVRRDIYETARRLGLLLHAVSIDFFRSQILYV